MLSIYDLAFSYINKNYTEISNNDKINIINKISEVLNNGSTSNDISNRIKKSSGCDREYNKFFDSIKSNGNLLKPNKFYYHNELRIVPGAPLREWNINTGQIENVTQEYYLEMKASYTIDDIINYIKRKEFLSRTLVDINRAKGSINFLLKRYDVDYLLFMIDTVNDIYSGKQKFARSLVEMAEFDDEAKYNYEQRITESKINGDDKITPKKRILFENHS